MFLGRLGGRWVVWQVGCHNIDVAEKFRVFEVNLTLKTFSVCNVVPGSDTE